MKTLISRFFLTFLTWPLRLISSKTKANIVSSLINFFSHSKNHKESLKFLFYLENHVYKLEGISAQKYGNGIHTKVRHLNYPNFFIQNINPGEKVLDIGCGKGTVDFEIIKKHRNTEITAIDLSKTHIEFAQKNYQHPKLHFINKDALKFTSKNKYEVVILSNVLEHFEKRTQFLKKIILLFRPKRLLIRVPLFERDWRVPLKQEIGIDYRLDPTHFIEYTQENFIKEMQTAHLKIKHLEVRWGEIWSVLEPLNNSNS